MIKTYVGTTEAEAMSYSVLNLILYEAWGTNVKK